MIPTHRAPPAFAVPAVLVAGLVSLGAPPARAIENRMVECARLLLGPREDHFTPSISAAHTRAALAELRLFRARHLRDLPYAPGGTPGEAAATSSRHRRARAARRISAIIDEGAVAFEDVDAGDAAESGTFARQITRASAVEGAAEVAAFIARLARAPEAGGDLARTLWFENLFYLAKLPLVALPLGLMTHAALAHPWSSTNLLAAGLFAAGRHVPESFVRGLEIYEWRAPLAARLREYVTDPAAPAWFAISRDYRVPADILRRTWASNELAAEDAEVFAQWRAYPRVSTRLAGRAISAYPLEPDLTRLATAWVRVDAVLTRRAGGAGDGPNLVFVTRVSETRPPYPRRAPSSNEDRGAAPKTTPAYGHDR